MNLSLKTWLTAREIAELQLSDMPATERGVQIWFDRNSALSRKRKGRGGGLEYHYLSVSLAGVVDYELQVGGPPPALDSLALRKRLSLIETAEGGKLFALLRRLHVFDPEASAATLRRKCMVHFGDEVAAQDLKTGRMVRVKMPPLEAFKKVMIDVRAFYALGATSRRVGFDRVFDRFARAKLLVAIGEAELLRLEEHIRSLCDKPQPAGSRSTIS